MLCHETDAVIKDEKPRGERLVRLVSTITMPPCSSIGAIECQLNVISRNLSVGAAVIRRRPAAGRMTSPTRSAAPNPSLAGAVRGEQRRIGKGAGQRCGSVLADEGG